ncbi:MAG: SH3 domain-containing protein [Chloroflexota bacterium]
MNHQAWQDLIPFYVAQTLSAEELRQFEAHLVGCETCQQEIDEWRTIASAVWRDTETIARTLPPLSPKVYEQLQQRKQILLPEATHTDSASVPTNVRQLPRQRSRVPLTLVAGIVVAVLFGGLLMMLALRQPQQDDDSEVIVLNSSVTPLSDSPAVNIIATVTQRPTDMGIIPTMAVDTSTPSVSLFATNTDVPPVLDPPPELPTDDPSIASMAILETDVPEASFNPTVFPTPIPPTPTETPDMSFVAPLGSGPHITLTPDVVDNLGRPLCELFNPTNAPIELYEHPDRNSQIVTVLVPDDLMRVVGRSNTGWYLIEAVSGGRGWLQQSFAYVRGNCDDSVPSVTVQPTATRILATTTLQAIGTPNFERVVVSASFADLYAEPSFDSAVIGVADRDDEFPVFGYQGTGTNRWVNVQLPDGSSAWVWASTVTEVDDAP